MKYPVLHLKQCLLALTVASSPAVFAGDGVDGEIEYGLMNFSDDSMRFGRFSGLTDSGIELNLGFKFETTDYLTEHANFVGTNLGLDSRSISIDWEKQGQYNAYIRYDQTPYNDFNGQTIFEGVGSSSLTLPAGWVTGNDTGDLTQLDSSLKDVEISTLRKKLALGGSKILTSKKNWTLSMDFSTENKEGLQVIGGLTGNPGSGRVALLPAPVDYTTNTFSASLGYLAAEGQLKIAYQSSLFYNNQNSLSWESPFNTTGSSGTAGSISLPPDNQMHQLSLSGGYRLFGTTQFTGMLSVAAMLQDDSFLGATPSPLPRNSLDGEIYQYNALLSLASRPARGFNLKASYRLSKRDNNTPRDTYSYYLNDDIGDINTATNDPYSFEKHVYKLDASYRINRTARLNGFIARETFESDQSEVKETTEDKAQLKLRLHARDNVEVSLGANISSRDGSSYQTTTSENPLLRKYNIADRDRIGGNLNIAYQPTDKLALSASLDVNDDDYDDTVVGLTSAQQSSLILDASYQFNKDLSAYGYLGREIYESDQAGSRTPNDPDWWVENEDTIDSMGFGFNWQQSSKLELGADYVMSLSEGQINMRSNNAQPTLIPFPDLESNLHSFKLYADYQWRKNTHVKISYLYEKYDEDDWSIDGVSYDTIPEVLTLGEANPSYEQHMIGLSLISRF